MCATRQDGWNTRANASRESVLVSSVGPSVEGDVVKLLKKSQKVTFYWRSGIRGEIRQRFEGIELAV